MASSEARFQALGVRIHAIDNQIDKENKMIKNNRFTDDTQDVRVERLTLLSANITAYGPMIGVPPPKITIAETSHDDYVGAIADAGVEDGQMDEAFETLNQAVEELAKYYALVRAHLQEIIWDYDKPDDFLHAYGFEGDSPTWASGLDSKIAQWKENHDLLVTAADPRVIADPVMTELVDKRANMISLRATAHAEKRESSEAYDALHELFAMHTKLLRFILTAAHLVWGDEDPRLLELGFQTKSGIWTPEEPEKLPAVTGLALEFLDPDLRLFWDEVEGADGYELREGNNPLIMARTIYEGPDTEFTYDPPGGHLYFRVWAKKGDEMGLPGDAIDIEIEGTPPGPPQNLNLTILSDGSLKVGWEPPLTGTPEYFRLYLAIVDTGSPAPEMSEEPYFDELITLGVGFSSPTAGKTYYVWVSAFDDGVEGDAAGPESIDIE